MFLKVTGSGSSFGTSHILSEAPDKCHLLNPWLILQWSYSLHESVFLFSYVQSASFSCYPWWLNSPRNLCAQFSSVAQLYLTLCDPMDWSTPGLSVHQQLLDFTQTHVDLVSNAIQPYHPLSSPCPLPSIFPKIRAFSNESVLRIRWPKYWSFSFNISPSNEYSELISFRVDWLDLLAVQGTLKRLLQHHSSKASVPRCSAFFIVQLSHPYMTTGKTIALTRQTFVGKVMSLLFNILSGWS